MSGKADREDLLSRFAAGDRLALEQLLLSYHDRLLYHIGENIREKLPAPLKSVIEAEEILQQTYVAVFRGIESFQPRSERAFYRWLATIAENQVRDAAKAQGRKKRGGGAQRVENQGNHPSSMVDLIDMLSDGGRSPSKIAAGVEGVKMLQVALAGLTDDYREAIRLSCLEGMSLEEVAEQMGRPEGAVRGLLYRAKKKLRDEMGQSSLWLNRK